MGQWPANWDDVVRCWYQMMQNALSCNSLPVTMQNTSPMPIAVCQSICLSLNTWKNVEAVFAAGLCVVAGDTVWSDAVEMEDVNDIAFTVQRGAGHCGMSVTASIETSPDSSNWDTMAYAGFTNLVFAGPCAMAGITPVSGFTSQATMPITTGPVYMRARIANASMNDVIVRAWLTLTNTCS